MSKKEFNDFVEILKREKEAATKHTKQQADTFLKSVGVMTPKGNLTAVFKEICTPKGQA